MTANELLAFLTQIIFILLSGLTIVDLIRHRDKARRDIALMFGSLAVIFLIQILGRIGGTASPLTSLLGLIALVSQPYLLLRVVRYFQPIPKMLLRAAATGMVVSWIAFALSASFSPIGAWVALLAIIAYFIGVNGYAMLVFVRGALNTTGVVRQRLRFGAAGSGLLAITMICLTLSGVIPTQLALFSLLSQLAAVASALSFYVGFASPRWLRRAWQLDELWGFLLRITVQPMADQLNKQEDTLRQLCHVANRAVGSLATIVLQKNETDGTWEQFNSASSTSERASVLPTDGIESQGAIGRALQELKPVTVHFSMNLNAADRALLEQVGAQTLLITPIASPKHTWGVLLVFMRFSSLFIDDDVSLLTLLAQQSSLILENYSLVGELQNYNQQLEQKTTQLSTANQELEAFSYSVSHDLRAPLRAINGFSRILSDNYRDQLPADMHRYLVLIRDNARQMGQLIDDLLAFSRLSRQSLKREPVAMGELAQRVFQELRIDSDSRRVDLRIGDLPTCKVDPALMKQVLVNLISNALKYTNKRDVTQIEVDCQERDNQQVFYVKDNGVGFDMQYADKLFNVFQRLHRAEDYEGTGVGLAIVQRILQRHGGKVWAEAEVDQGATFYFTVGGGEQAYEYAS